MKPRFDAPTKAQPETRTVIAAGKAHKVPAFAFTDTDVRLMDDLDILHTALAATEAQIFLAEIMEARAQRNGRVSQ